MLVEKYRTSVLWRKGRTGPATALPPNPRGNHPRRRLRVEAVSDRLRHVDELRAGGEPGQPLGRRPQKREGVLFDSAVTGTVTPGIADVGVDAAAARVASSSARQSALRNAAQRAVVTSRGRTCRVIRPSEQCRPGPQSHGARGEDRLQDECGAPDRSSIRHMGG